MDTQIVKTIGRKRYNRSDQEVIPCCICGEGTLMTGTEHCDRCHELDTRIQSDLAIAERLVNYYLINP